MRAGGKDNDHAVKARAEPGPAPVQLAPLRLRRRMTVDQAFRAIAGACLAQVQGNADGVAHGANPEHVHQMRVGLRRLRSALGLFRTLAPLPADLNDELRWLGSALGAARDWEVLAHTMLGPVHDAAPAGIAALGLPHAAGGMARRMRAQAAAAVQSPRYASLMRSFQRWLRGAQWRGGAARGKLARLAAPVPGFADAELERSQRLLLKRGKRLDGADAATRHRARIAAKKARYTMEFFKSLYAPHQVENYLGALSDLQDELGHLNDATVADGLLEELAGQQPELAPATWFARGHLASAPQYAAKPLDKRWKRFARLGLPRKR